MRKFLSIAAIALLGTVGLSACNNDQQANTTVEAGTTRPSSTAVDDAMKACLAEHPNQPTPAPAQTAAPAMAQTAAPAMAQTAVPAMAQTAAPTLVRESSGNDDCVRATIAASTWQAYLQHIVTENMGNVSNNPYVYFVPAARYPENVGAIARVQDQLNTVVAATVLPGNMVAAAGPDSATTARLLETAFANASPGSFKGVVVLFIGDPADEAAVKAAVEPSGATFKFVQM